MIKVSLFNLNESFFGQSILLLFPILVFSTSFEFSLLIGGLAFVLIYVSTLTFAGLAPLLEKVWLFPLLLSLAILSGTLISCLSFYLYPLQFASAGYLINLFFVSLLTWQKNLLTSRKTSTEKINSELLSSLFWVLLALWTSGFLRELLGTGSLIFFGETFMLIPESWTLPLLKQMAGGFLFLFLSAVALRLSPAHYAKTSSLDPEIPPASSSLKTLEQTISERTSRLERLLNENTSSQ